MFSGFVGARHFKQSRHFIPDSTSASYPITPFLGAHIDWQTTATGIEFMDSPPKTLKATLEAIRDMAADAPNQVAESQEKWSMSWHGVDVVSVVNGRLCR
jgi:hypothetical protein